MVAVWPISRRGAVNLRIANNVRTKKATETLVQDAIEAVIDVDRVTFQRAMAPMVNVGR